MSERSFAPAWGSTSSVANSATATAAIVLPKSCLQVSLTNTSATARTHVMVTPYTSEASVPTGDAPTTSTGYAVLPNTQTVITVGPGCKVIRTIATAADGNIIITPGNGFY